MTDLGGRRAGRGADDYLNKPFEAHEPLTRAKAVLRRSQSGQPSLSTAWSDDGVQIAFASLRRVYVSPRGGNPCEVYVADDTFVQPAIWQMQFSPDQQHLLLDVYDGVPKFVSVALDSGEATQVTWPGLNLDYQARNFSWRP